MEADRFGSDLGQKLIDAQDTDNYKHSELEFSCMVALATVDLVLDVILKLVFIALLVFVFLLLRNLDKAVQSLERSVESMERSAETVEDIISVARKIPFVGGKRGE